MKYLILDMSNILHRAFHIVADEDIETIIGATHTIGLSSIHRLYQIHKPDVIVTAWDRSNWRKVYTESEECVSGWVYKDRRNRDKTPTQKKKLEALREQMIVFEDMLRTTTTVMCMSANMLEADDLIAGMCQFYPSDEHVIISSDRDLMQLLVSDNITLISPDKDTERTLDDYDNNPALFLYEKCFRGEQAKTGDNIMSAYPRLRRTKIVEAFDDPYKHTALMEHAWVDKDGRMVKVGEIHDENNLLMNLSAQPEPIRDKMRKVIDAEMNRERRYSLRKFMRYVGSLKHTKIKKNVKNYTGMLSVKPDPDSFLSWK